MARHTRNRRTQRRGKSKRQTRGKRTQRGGFLGLFEDTSFDIQKKINDNKAKLDALPDTPENSVERQKLNTENQAFNVKYNQLLAEEKNPEQKQGWFDSLFNSTPQAAAPVTGPGYSSPQVASPVAARGGRRRRRSHRK